METNMEKLLKKIHLEQKDYQYFQDAILNKIIGNKTKDKYVFDIALTNPFKLDTYLNFISLLKKEFKNYQVYTHFSLKHYDLEDILIYYQYFMKQFSAEHKLLEIFLDCKISLNDKELIVEINNKAEQIKFNSIKNNLEEQLQTLGFDINIKTKIVKNKTDILKVDIKIPKTVKKTINRNILGGPIKGQPITIDNISFEMDNVIVCAKVFDINIFESSKTNFKIITLKITDGTDSIYCKIFTKDDNEFNKLKQIKENQWYLIKGYTKNDKYANEIVLNARDINKIDKKEENRIDEAKEKRIELHTHTKMSQMDGICDPVKLVKTAYNWGHDAIAITDHNGAQSFPDVFHTVCKINKNLKENEKPFKAIYGTELTLIDDTVNIVLRENNSKLLDNTYVVFDFETTGLNAGGEDSIIEIGAVKIKDGEIIDRYDQLINPGKKLSKVITDITNITDEMLKGQDTEEKAVKKFKQWFGDLPMVAHNAKFDVSFLEMAYEKYGLGDFTNPVIDTLELSRTLDTNYSRHSLTALVKRYNVPWDEEAHHRADYDAEGTALVFHKMLLKLNDRNFELMSDLNHLVSKNEIHKYGTPYHVNILVKNKKGLKNLFKIISLANTKYLYKTPRILRSEIEKHREGLLIGSGCYQSEVFVEARSKSDEELTNIIRFYDYVEVQPLDYYDHLIQMNNFANKLELMEHIKKIIRVAQSAGKIVVATGDVHHINNEDRIYREIIVNQKVPGGGRHPLSRKNITKIPSLFLKTTNEMLESFDFLDEKTKKEIVIDNTHKIADMVDIIEVIIDTDGIPFSPKIDNSVKIVTDMVYQKAHEIYGNPLPYNIEERLAEELYGDFLLNVIKDQTDSTLSTEEFEKEYHEKLNRTIIKGKKYVEEIVIKYIKETKKLSDKEAKSLAQTELTAIIGGEFDAIYLIAQKLVKKSNDDGYLVGSRGSVGSSLVATMMGITEVNALPPHYVCPKCQHSMFEEKGEAYTIHYNSGYDLPNKKCPKCHTLMNKEGQDMPFATFLGFHADKVPDIDLNFSDLNQAAAHEYTKELFGVDNVYRAGTIGTVADKTAFGFVKGYCEDKGIMMRNAEIERLAQGCTGVKRTTGQHPGGIVVIPNYMDVFDFTPFQYPADDVTSNWRTTHFDYHAIDKAVLKLDILGHSGPTKLRIIQDLTGEDVTKVPLDDKDTMKIFLSPDVLGVTKEQIMCETGTLGIPEFGTTFTIGLVTELKPKTFAELIKISGLSHGTDVWNGNASELIKNNVVPFSEVIGCRDGIMDYLMQHGLDRFSAFSIMEFVRKGKASDDPKKSQPEKWKEYKKILLDNNIADWYIQSCEKIKYMFPKAHAVAYVINAFRIAYYKVHNPLVYYTAQFSTEYDDFDIDAMIKGYSAIKNKIIEIQNKGYDASNKETSMLECLKVALECTARGIQFSNIDLNESDSINFKIKDNQLLPPFRTIDGLGSVVAKNIVKEREKGKFLSVEDLQKRAKISNTLIEKMRTMGVLDGMDESSQLSLF